MIKKVIVILFVLLIVTIAVTSAVHLFSEEEGTVSGNKTNYKAERKLTMQEIDSIRAVTSMDRSTAENLPPNFYISEVKSDGRGI